MLDAVNEQLLKLSELELAMQQTYFIVTRVQMGLLFTCMILFMKMIWLLKSTLDLPTGQGGQI